ncbi:hypothetical protein MRX96_049952 [Rhipicephalus microplus]
MTAPLGTSPGRFICSAIKVHGWGLLPWLPGTANLQPSMNLLEHHCCQGQYFLSVHAAFRTMTDFLLDNRKMASAFSACRNNTEHEATSEEPLAILPLCLLLLRHSESAASWRPCLRAA